MFERFTDRARWVVRVSQDEARRLNHDCIGTEHMLLALVRQDEGVAVEVLKRLGISPEDTGRQVEEAIGRGGQTPPDAIPFTPRTKKVLELSLREAVGLGHNYVGTEHILLGLIREGEGVAAQVLLKLGATTLDPVRKQVIQVLSIRRDKKTTTADGAGRSASPRTPILDRFGRNLTLETQIGALGPLVGREREMERVVQILTRRNRNVPLLVGEPGVGTEALAAGLSEAITQKEVPPVLQSRTVHSLDLGALVTEAQHRGRVNELTTGVLDEVRKHSTLVLFLTGALTPLYIPSGTTNPLAVFQSLLGEPGAFVLGACGQAEYRRREYRPGLDRLIQTVLLDELPTGDVLAVLRTVRKRLQRHHKVTITDEALEAAASLARDHVPDQVLPGAAVDLLDEASAQVRVRAVRSEGDSVLEITRSDVVTALAVYSGTQSPAPSRPTTAQRIEPVEHDPYVWSMS
ncbi:Clp protease N-terminal domain-containing protein [Streptomyces sp. NPDC046862]|uniref:Clp protease N-terminal domain-containing protein n=1 Tax=Streptomyces sp. NPDC046862 TaxID=3154603 RepID=UPI0034553A2E